MGGVERQVQGYRARLLEGRRGTIADFAKRVSGSGDLFNKRGRRPWASVNFVTAHDGFNLNDLVSYNDKHNEANGEDNRDGHGNNHSWNCGAEGPTEDPEITALRERQKRNMLATMLLSHGTPMLLAGDEFGHTQNGNNNAYAQDNETTWLDWMGITANGRSLREFTRKLIATRKAFPILYRSRFLVGSHNEELDVKDVDVAVAVGRRNDHRAMAGRQRQMFRDAARRARPGDRDQAPRLGRDHAADLQCPPRRRELHIARRRRGAQLDGTDRHQSARKRRCPRSSSAMLTRSPDDRCSYSF